MYLYNSIIYLIFYIYVDSFICVNYHFLKYLLQFLRDASRINELSSKTFSQFSLKK